MAIIYSYPLNDDIKPLDELVGTTEKSINGQLKTVTRNFLLADLAEFFIVDGGLQKEIILTTNGTSGASTLDQLTGVLNIPQYSGATDLGYIASALNGIVTSSTGLDATIPLANSTNAGLLNPAGFIVLGNTSGINTGDQNLQSVTNMGSVTTNSITANSFIKSGGTGTNILLDNGSTVALSSVVGNTNLSTSQTATNFTINSDTGTDASVPLGDGTLAGATLNDYTTTEKNKLAAITGTNTGDQNLQSVTNLGATTTNPITANSFVKSGGTSSQFLKADGSVDSTSYTTAQNLQQVTDIGATTTNTITINPTPDNTGLDINPTGDSYGIRVIGQGGGNSGYFTSVDANTLIAQCTGTDGSIPIIALGQGKGLYVLSIDDTVAEFNQSLTNKGLVINSGTSSTGNFIELNKNGVDKLVVNQAGELTAQKLIKDGGTASQILAADGSVITAGTNITITGGQISSVGGAGGGGSSVNYYLNGGTSQGTFGGTTYYEFSKTAVIGTGADFTISSNGYIASFITDVSDPSLLLIPAGNWNLEFFFNSSSAGGSPSFYVELYKYDGTTFTSIASSSANPEGITGGTAIDAYFTSLAVPETVLTVNDRLAIRVFVNASSKTITLHTQNGHLCEVITTFTAGLTALNGLQAQVQNFATGTTGTDFDINSSGSTHTFNLPSASATNRGALSSANWTTFNNKLTPNTAITGATNTKITYDANGLVTAGTTLIASDIPNIAQSQVTSLTTDLGLKANLASPTFSGTPTLPTETIATTQTAGDSSTKLATTAFVTTANNLKQDKSLSAYKLIANNTNTTANGVEQVYKDIAEATDLSTVSTISWIATTAPTSPTSLNYKWTQIGSLVIARFNLNYTNAGTTVQQLSITLPNTMPTPLSPIGYTAANDVLYQVIGNYAASKAAAGAMPTSSVLRRNAANNGYELVINRVAANVTSAQLTVQYFT